MPLLDYIKFTPAQVQFGSRFGFNVDQWRVLPELMLQRGGWFETSVWNRLWTNPLDYNESNLRIPYRFQKNAFTQHQQSNIELWLNELSGYVDHCIEFYNQGIILDRRNTFIFHKLSCTLNY